MNQKVKEYLDNLVNECTKSEKFSHLSDEEKTQKQALLADYFNQLITDTILANLSQDQLDKLENIDFQSEEGLRKFAEVTSELPGFTFLEIGSKLREEAEKIKKSGTIPA